MPTLVTTSTVDPSGQRLLHLVNVAPSPVTFALTHHGEPFLGGRRLRLPARSGLILPAAVRVGGAMLVATTRELVAREDAEVVLRPTQDEDVFDTDQPVRPDRGEMNVVGSQVTVTLHRDGSAGRPVRITVD
jgi:beta-galactosidase